MCVYVTHLATRTSPPPLQYSSIKNYTFGLQAYHAQHGHLAWLDSLVHYHKCMMGIRRHLGDKGRQLDRPRLPITTTLLAQIRPRLVLDRTNYTHVVFWAAATLGTYGLLRMAEFCVPSARTTHLSLPAAESSSAVASSLLEQIIAAPVKYSLLTLAQVKLYSKQRTLIPLGCPHLLADVAYFTITLRISKTDQGRKGMEVVISNPVPVRAMALLLSLHPSLSRLPPAMSSMRTLSASVTSSPLFLLGDNTILSRDVMIDWTRFVISSLGLDASLYSGHSFRRGGATSLAERGVDHSLIKAMGRWKSDAYMRYIVTSIDKVIESSNSM